MRKLLFILLCVVLVICSAAGVLYWRTWRVQYIRRTTPAFSPQELSYQLNPPSDTTSGVVAGYNGTVMRVLRGETEPVPIQVNDRLYEGERVSTESQSSVALDFQGIGRLDLASNTEVSLSSTLPYTFLIQQRRGTVNYVDIQPDYPLSIRVLQSLVELQDGRVQVEIQQPNRRVLVRLLNGTARVSMIDADNNTQVVTLTGAQDAVINETQKTITVQE